MLIKYDKKGDSMKKIGSFLKGILLIPLIVILGCTSSNNQGMAYPQEIGNNPAEANNRPSGNLQTGYNNSMRGISMANISREQRQQIIQVMIAACQDRMEGDTCTAKGSRGTRTGTCRTRNEQLICNTGNYSRQGQTPVNGQ